MQAFLRDLRFGARMLGRDPGFTVLAILALALVIGMNTAIFSVTSALLLRPFRYSDPQDLVSISVKEDATEHTGTLLRYEMLRDKARSFDGVAAWTDDNFNLSGVGDPVQVPVARVTSNFFSLLGIRPQFGRTFTNDEGRPECPPVVILSNAIWRSRFNSDPDIVGKKIALDGIPNIVIGVLPADARFPFVGTPDIWSPRYFELTLMSAQHIRLGAGYLGYVGRLHPDTTMAQADAELAVLNQHYSLQNPTMPDADSAIQMTAVPLRDLVVGDVRTKLWILSAAAAVLLLIGCANVASLLLSRALARRRELAVRAALGASRGAVIRQLLTESVLLAVASGALGIALAWIANRALTTWGSGQLPPGMPVGIDLRVLAFTLATSLFTGLATGLFPALQLTRIDLNSTLREEGRGFAGGRNRAHLKNLLVICQVALSVPLLIGAGLLIRSFDRLLHVDPGFRTRNVLTMEISLPTEKYSRPDQQIAFFNEALRRIKPLPGVRNAAISAAQPLTPKRITPVLPEGQPNVPLAQRPFLDIEAISPDWFQTMRVPVLAGRTFTDADDTHAPRVVIVNETFARRFWPGQNPVGKTMVVGRGPSTSEVVGVAADVHNMGLAENTQAQLYLPFPQLAWGDMNLFIRTVVPPLSLVPAVRAQIAAIDSDQPLTAIQTVDDLMDNSRAQPRFTTFLLGAFSLTALGLAAIGLYAVLAWTVTQRRQEMGIRMALGAERNNIVRLVVRQGMLLVATGIFIGLIAGFLLTRFLQSTLYKTGTHDMATFILAPLALLAIAFLACYLPAQRATKVDPVETLKAG